MYLLLLTTLLFAAHGVFVSCDDNEDFTTSPSAKLTFPADTLRLDTALTVVSSPTYSFTVHNRTSKGIRITNVALANPESSGFRVNVDGTFINDDYDYAIEVRSHDSIAVWVDITPRFQDSDDPVLVTDRLMFTLESGVVQQVVLQPLPRAPERYLLPFEIVLWIQNSHGKDMNKKDFFLLDISESFEFPFVFAPGGIYLYEHFKKYLFFKEFLHVFSGLYSYTL